MKSLLQSTYSIILQNDNVKDVIIRQEVLFICFVTYEKLILLQTVAQQNKVPTIERKIKSFLLLLYSVIFILNDFSKLISRTGKQISKIHVLGRFQRESDFLKFRLKYPVPDLI